MGDPSQRSAVRRREVPFSEAVKVWARVAALSFGGPAGQIAVMHRILVEEKRWIGERRFLHALNYCMLLPGPEATQLAIYIGWLLHKTRGGIVAGTLFVLPGFVTLMILSWLYAAFGDVGIVQALFFGLKAAVLAIVAEALVRIGRRALRNGVMKALAVAAFVAIFFLHLPFPLIILGAAVIGWSGNRLGLASFQIGESNRGGEGADTFSDADSALGEETPLHARPNVGSSLKSAIVCSVLWLGPVAALLIFLGPSNVFSQIALFFSKMAVVTFGGAYAVLAYVAQQAVQTYGWLRPGEMLDGLGMAETTPGPLIMVTEFVGFMGAFRNAAEFSPLIAGTLGGLLTTWVTFTPCFLWIFLGAPFIESLRENKALAAALAAITAAVVGVILNLAIWFALHVLFAVMPEVNIHGLFLPIPDFRTLDAPSLLLTIAALIAVFRYEIGMIQILAGCSFLGILYYLAMGALT